MQIQIEIQVNGQIQITNASTSVQALLENLGYQNRKIAVELNELILPSRLYGVTLLKEKDCLEIVQAIGGG